MWWSQSGRRQYCVACWLSKATCAKAHTCAVHPPTHTHAYAFTHTCAHIQKCVILTAFPLQQWLHEHASMLCYTYIAFLVMLCPCLLTGLPSTVFHFMFLWKLCMLWHSVSCCAIPLPICFITVVLHEEYKLWSFLLPPVSPWILGLTTFCYTVSFYLLSVPESWV
jgi:hypothetical protein